MGLCSCGAPPSPIKRYIRLVNGCFPKKAEDGLNNSGMQKLIYYALLTSQHLPAIGKCFEKKHYKYLQKGKKEYVLIAMNAMDELVQACHEHLGLFGGSVLRMIETLLESTDVDYQVVAADSFVNFARIKEEVSEYQTHYDFFMSKFSQMCWYTSEGNTSDTVRVRMAGLKALRAAINKTFEDNYLNMWDSADKVLPAILFNLKEQGSEPGVVADNSRPTEQTQGVEMQRLHAASGDMAGEDSLRRQAQVVLTDIAARTNWGNMSSFLKPTLLFFSEFHDWDKGGFAYEALALIFAHMQQTYHKAALGQLVSYLNQNSKELPPATKINVVQTLVDVLELSKGPIGPSVVEIISTHAYLLFESLEIGHKSTGERVKEEEEFRRKLITSIGLLATRIPEFNQTETLEVVADRMSADNSESGEQAIERRKVVLRVIYEMCMSYTCNSLHKLLIPPVLTEITRGMKENNCEVRQLAHLTLRKLVGEAACNLHHASSTILEETDLDEEGKKMSITLEGPKERHLSLDIPISDESFFRKNCRYLRQTIVESLMRPVDPAQDVFNAYQTLNELTSYFGYIDALQTAQVMLAMQAYSYHILGKDVAEEQSEENAEGIQVPPAAPQTAIFVLELLSLHYFDFLGRRTKNQSLQAKIDSILQKRREVAKPAEIIESASLREDVRISSAVAGLDEGEIYPVNEKLREACSNYKDTIIHVTRDPVQVHAIAHGHYETVPEYTSASPNMYLLPDELMSLLEADTVLKNASYSVQDIMANRRSDIAARGRSRSSTLHHTPRSFNFTRRASDFGRKMAEHVTTTTSIKDFREVLLREREPQQHDFSRKAPASMGLVNEPSGQDFDSRMEKQAQNAESALSDFLKQHFVRDNFTRELTDVIAGDEPEQSEVAGVEEGGADTNSAIASERRSLNSSRKRMMLRRSTISCHMEQVPVFADGKKRVLTQGQERAKVLDTLSEDCLFQLHYPGLYAYHRPA
eukprot:Clim_evm67s172 gene=Clim_evmTU67s172